MAALLLAIGGTQLNGNGADGAADRARQAVQDVKAQFARDSHLRIFSVDLTERGQELVLTGEVDSAETKTAAIQAVQRAGVTARDEIVVLPAENLGDKQWGIACLSVASGREQPEHKAEMGTQILMGTPVRVWKRSTNSIFAWYYTQSADGYLAWLEEGTFVRCTQTEVDAWNRGPLLIVTALEDAIREAPQPGATTISDVVIADRVKNLGDAGDWYKVGLPDGRTGFLPKSSAEDFAAWKQSRQPTADNIERTGRRLLGRPYLWGANSPKGLDCSGFTKLVFYLNGVDLNRNASHQARQGTDVPLDAKMSRLKKGDLLFFGQRAGRGQPERVTHVGIYLGNKEFIHSSERVRINSLDPSSPIWDKFRMQTLLRARRVLGANQ